MAPVAVCLWSKLHIAAADLLLYNIVQHRLSGMEGIERLV